jgi:hypothetical protein
VEPELEPEPQLFALAEPDPDLTRIQSKNVKKLINGKATFWETMLPITVNKRQDFESLFLEKLCLINMALIRILNRSRNRTFPKRSEPGTAINHYGSTTL